MTSNVGLGKRYKVICHLGKGAQGEVLLAEDRQQSGKTVAIKLLIPKEGDDWLGFFKREFEVLAGLKHPRLARVYDFGTTEEGKVFFSREYIAGQDLKAATAMADVPTVLKTAVEVCRALRPLHQRHMMHGDLKPGNVIVDSSGLAHLIDFSFVRQSGQHEGGNSGTLQYLSPEAIEGKVLDLRADLYALGATLFEILSGSPPFDGTTSEIIAGHLGDDRPELSFARVDAKGHQSCAVFEGLTQIVSRLLRRNRNDRFPDIDEVEAALISLEPQLIERDPLPSLPVLTVSSGREEEYARIEQAVFSKLNNAKDQPIFHLISGEAGTGKSAIMRRIKWQAQLEGHCVITADLNGGKNRLEPISAMVEQLSQLAIHASFEQRFALNLLSQIENFGIETLDLMTLGAQVASLLVRSCSGKALLLIDDLDRMSEEALLVLRGTLAQVEERHPLAIVATALPDFSWRTVYTRGVTFFLPGLDRQQIKSLLQLYFGQSDDASIDRLMAHTGGNPLFVGALLDDLKINGEGLARLERLGPPQRLEAYWRSRLASLSPAEMQLMSAGAVIGHGASVEELAKVGECALDAAKGAAAHLVQLGWFKAVADGFVVATPPLAREILSEMAPEVKQLYHRRALATEADEALKMLHTVYSGDVESAWEKAADIALGLEKSGALSAAGNLLRSVYEALGDHEGKEKITLALGRIALAQGDHDSATEYLLTLKGDDPFGRKALLLLGRSNHLRGQYKPATDYLTRALAMTSEFADTASIYCELANIAFSRGDLAEVDVLVEKGFAFVQKGHPVRCDLLCVVAKNATYKGDHKKALYLCKEANDEAEQCGDRRTLAYVIQMTSWVLQQSGDLHGGFENLEKAAAIYREIGDFARLMRALSALGDCCWWLEKYGQMLVFYEEAMRLSSAVGNPVQRIEVKVSVSQALVKVGRFERAVLLLKEAKDEAFRANLTVIHLKAYAFEGDAEAGQGRGDKALRIWSQVIEGLDMDSPGHQGLCAERELEMAQLLLWRASKGDVESARNLIEKAKSRKREELGRRFDDLLTLQEGALCLAQGDLEKSRGQLDALIARLESKKNNLDLVWQAELTLARYLIAKGSAVLARKRLRHAEHILEKLSADIPSEHRLAFWQDIRREEVRRLLLATVPSSTVSPVHRFGVTEAASSATDSELAGLYRILEFNKRLSTETDLGRLLENILDAAIELTGAERGFVLMPGKDGFEVKAVRQIEQEKPNVVHEQFSRSIAESVYLDGEPVITIDAMGDERFNEFLSIHELNIRSVACVPVSFRNHCFGVLYLENRLRRGRFDGKDLRVLSAFSDQVAIAVFQSKLIEDARLQNKQLEETSRQLKDLCDHQASLIDENQADLHLAKERLSRVRTQLQGDSDFHGMIGSCPQMRSAFSLADRAKDLDVPVSLIGLSGTGKDLLAKIIHDTGSRQGSPFVPLSCGAVPPTLLESTLFGYVKGAFSGAVADSPGLFATAQNGTLYLDDIGEMPPRMQIDLLRVLQEGSYVPLGGSKPEAAQCRLLVSAKEPLENLVKSKLLREDLFYRLQVLTIFLPPLNERSDDVLLLARKILTREALMLDKKESRFSKEALQAINAYSWPGNVREMQQCIRRALVMADDGQPIEASMLALSHTEDPLPKPKKPSRPEQNNTEESRILAALKNCKWNRSQAAKQLGYSRRTFYRRLEQLGIDIDTPV